MKRIINFCIASLSCLSIVAQSDDAVVMTINGKPVYKSEFEYIYNKNSSSSIEPKKSLKNYVDMFVNFKLKVAEAQSRGYDTTQTFIKELAGYQKQLAQPYLTDKSVEKQQVREAYDRLINQVEASHILIGLGDASPADTLKAYQKALAVRTRLLNGEEFGKVAREVSEDPSAKQNGGYLGYFKGFMMVFPFEDAAYKASIGEITQPVRSQFGYHIIKVMNRRPDQGQVRVAHIMTMFPQGATDADKKTSEEKIMAINQELLAGADFAELAKAKSEDQYSAVKGGEMPIFEAFRLPREFEDVAFGLQNPGDCSQPFATDFGYHIVKLLEKKAPASFEERETMITKEIARQDRSNTPRSVFVAKLKDEYNFKSNDKACSDIASWCASVPDSTMIDQLPTLTGTLFVLGGETYDRAAFVSSLIKKGEKCAGKDEAYFQKQLQAYTDDCVIAYEEKQLDRKYPEYRNLMKEYHDGILLFEVSNQEVWEKAAKDDTGLQKHFEKNRKKYTFAEPRFKGFLLQCNNDSTLAIAKEIIATAAPDSIVLKVRKTLNDKTNRVRIEKLLAAQGDNKWADELVYNADKKVERDAKYPVVEVVGKSISAPESYKDVRGPVTSDYQNELERNWIKTLRRKFKVVINKKTLKTVHIEGVANK